MYCSEDIFLQRHSLNKVLCFNDKDMKFKILFILAVGLLFSGCILTQQPNSTSSTAVPADADEKPRVNMLDLSGQQLTKVPEYVFGQKNLEELNVSNNQLTGAIQAQIRQLQNLKVLNASNNRMTGVPAEIGQLENLQVLDLSNNQLTGLPHELGNLKNLKILNISGNNYSTQDLQVIKEKLPATVTIIK